MCFTMVVIRCRLLLARHNLVEAETPLRLQAFSHPGWLLRGIMVLHLFAYFVESSKLL